MLSRFKLSGLIAGALAAMAFVSIAAAATATATVGIGSGPYVITPGTYWSSVTMTCPTGATACTGTLSLETAYAIKPYPSRPKTKAKVADVAYSIPAGTTKRIRARVYGPALAQAMKARAVTLRLTAWQTDKAAPAPSRIATFTLAHR
jgi:hypothetical protein